MSGSIPLVDATAYKQRNAVLKRLPVVLVSNWSHITPEALKKAHETMSAQSFDVSILYAPYWYDVYLTALGFKSD